MARRETVVLVAMTLAFMVAAGAAGIYVLVRVLPDTSGAAEERVRRGRDQAIRGNLRAAIDELSLAIAEDPRSIEAYLARAEAYDRSGAATEAVEDYTSALAVGASFRAFTGRARVRLRTGDLERAVDDLSRAIDLSPEVAGLWLARGRTRRQLGQFDDAVVDVAQAWELSPGLGNIHNDIAWAQWGVDDYEGALRSFDRALRRRPGLTHHLFGRGVTLYHLGRFEEADATLTSASGGAGGGRVYAAFYRWLNRAAAGNRSGAESDLRAYVTASDGSVIAPWARRIADFLLGDLDEATFLEDAAAGTWQPAAEQLCEACYYAGAVRRIDGDDAGAVTLFRRAIATDQRNYYEYYSARAELRDLGGVPD